MDRSSIRRSLMGIGLAAFAWAAPASAAELWLTPVAPTATTALGNWGATPTAAAQFSFTAPGNMTAFTAAKVVIIGQRNQATSYTLSLSIAHNAQAQDLNTYAAGPVSFTTQTNILQEIDVTSIFSHPFTAGVDSLGLNFTIAKATAAEVVGLRFIYVGPVGPTGPQGPQGQVGPQGQQGQQGAQGPQGQQGPAGPQGQVGPAGSQGEQGQQGAPGPQGTQGVQGPVGPSGDAGPAGSDGQPGMDGAPGPAGPQGNDGAPGPQGAQGVPGSEGPQGEIGPTGPGVGNGTASHIAFFDTDTSVTSDPDLSWDITNKRLGVGVDLDSLGARLVVQASGDITSTGTVQIRQTDADQAVGMKFVNSGNAGLFNDIADVNALLTGTRGGILAFNTRSDGDESGSPAERMRIDNTGNVGIGTATPAAPLDVNGTVQMTGFSLLTGAVNGYVLTSDESGAGTWQPGVPGPEGPPGPQGDPGPPGGPQGPSGPEGPQGLNGLPYNPLQVALLKWGMNTSTKFQVDRDQRGIAFDGSNMWVASDGGTVTKLRVNDGAILNTFTLGGHLKGIAFDGANIWVSETGANAVIKLRASDGSVLDSYPVGRNPHKVVFDGAHIWVSNSDDNTVTELQATDGSNLGTIPVGNYPSGLAFDGQNIWVANTNDSSLTEIRASDGVVLTTIGTEGTLYPGDVVFDGSCVWTADVSDPNATKIRVSDGAVLGTFWMTWLDAGSQAMAFDGANIWIVNIGYGTAAKLRASDGTYLGNYRLPMAPYAVAFDGANIWVAGNDDTLGGLVSKI